MPESQSELISIFIGNSEDASAEATAIRELEPLLVRRFDLIRSGLGERCRFGGLRMWDWRSDAPALIGGQAEVINPALRKSQIGVFVFKERVGEVTRREVNEFRNRQVSQRHLFILFPESPPSATFFSTIKGTEEWLELQRYKEELSSDWSAEESKAALPQHAYKDAESLKRILVDRLGDALHAIVNDHASQLAPHDGGPPSVESRSTDVHLENVEWELVLQYAARHFDYRDGCPEPADQRRTLLRRFGLLQDARGLSRAAVICFCKRPETVFAQTRALFVNVGMDGRFVSKDVVGPASVQLKTLLDLTMSHLSTVSRVAEHGERIEEKEIPPLLVRELLSNAIAHRDYDANGCVTVRLTADFLEVQSPGYFRIPWRTLLDSPSDISQPADPEIMLFMRNLLASEQIGHGFRVIRDHLMQYPKSIDFEVIGNAVSAIRVSRAPAATTSVGNLVTRLSDLLARSAGSAPERAVVRDEADAVARDIRRLFTPSQGSVIANARLRRIVGAGSFGLVWEAADIDSGEIVAVKILRMEQLTLGRALSRFRQSIRVHRLLTEVGRLSKSEDQRIGIAGFRNEDATGLAFSMDLLLGGSLNNIEALHWSLAKKLDVFARICATIAYAHQYGVLHRDIKPANVLLRENGDPVLTDFDLAEVAFSTAMSTVGQGGLGTVMFSAPEQLENATNATTAVDVYSLGRVLHFMLLERSPGFNSLRDSALPDLAAFPRGLVEIVRRATRIDPTQRYSSVGDLMAAVERWQHAYGAPTYSWTRLFHHLTVRPRALLIVGLLIAASALLLLVLVLHFALPR